MVSMCVLVPGGLWPRVYDLTMRRAERRGLTRIREEALRAATGHTLELGAGTGANLAAYPRAAHPLVVTEPDPHKARVLRRRADLLRPDAQVLHADAGALDFPDEMFDSVVVTLVLCTVPDQAAALGEIRRVLRPGGRLVFVEHVRSTDPLVARRQDRWQPAWSLLAGGCRPNRDTGDAIARAGFRLSDLQIQALPAAPRIVRPLAVGCATRDDGAASP
jgi:ubiquinone/menaquinone biosynthesis C-methylase UbiE